MVSRRTGRPRGRPRKPKPPPQAHGRPKYKFARDPDRYVVALLDAMLMLEMGSERACAMGIAAQAVGWQGRRPTLSIVHPGLIVTNWRKQTKPGIRKPKTLEGRAAVLREKRRRAPTNPIEPAGRWRQVMGWCFKAVLAAGDAKTTKAAVARWADLIGEGAFARQVLYSMIDAKFSPPE
jgi:hypothetical protein